MSPLNCAIPLALLITAAPLAANCPPPFAGANTAYFYNTGAGIGACSLPWTLNEHVVAINGPQWEGAAHCGECLRVTGPLGTTVVRVVDRCPECASGTLDLSPEAFAAIANPAQGFPQVQWERVDCPVNGNIAYHFQDSSAFFLSLQPRNHRQGVQSVSILLNGSFVPIQREDYNRFVLPTGTGSPGAFQIRVTSSAGEVLDQAFDVVPQDAIVEGSGQFSPCSNELFRNGFE